MTSQEDNSGTGFFRASVYLALVVLITFFIGIACLIVFFFQPRGEVGYWFIENIPTEGPFLLMSTHNSHFDIPVLIKEVPRQFRIVAKGALFKIPVFGWALSVAGYVRVDRGDREQAFASLDMAAEGVRSGMPLLIFPEGTRSPDGSLGPFKKGGFVLAAKSKAPIVPVVIEGTYRVLVRKTWRVRPGRVKATFLRPIDTSAYTYETREELMEHVRAAISGALRSGTDTSAKPGLTAAV
jgi:1-acyl-sn-glycerol-3-phosphate acyltransferase